MELFPGRGRCSEEEEVEMIGSSSSSSPHQQLNWGSQFYDKNHKIWLPEYDQSAGSSSGQPPPAESSGGAGGSGGGEDQVVCIEREHMFDKVVTPSDVGKLNRLVIPKQHAEKYFPLDSSSNEKGLLLNFEDRTGKPWRFRYSYWNSSQSYVMTKGWSRFVKEKKLYAGDIVSFERGAEDSVKDRLFIDWKRRSDVQDPSGLHPLPLHHHHHLLHPLSMPRPWGPGLILPPNIPMPLPPRDDMVWQRMNYGNYGHMHTQYPQRTNYSGVSSNSPIFYLRSSASMQHIGGADAPMVYNSVPVVHGKASAKRLRLFGVNLDCPIPENPEYQFLDPSPTMRPLTTPQTPSSHPHLQLSLYNTESPSREQSDSPRDTPSSMSLDLDI